MQRGQDARHSSPSIPLNLWCFGKVYSDFDLMAETWGGVSEKTVICLRIEILALFCDHSASCLGQRSEMSRQKKVESGDGG